MVLRWQGANARLGVASHQACRSGKGTTAFATLTSCATLLILGTCAQVAMYLPSPATNLYGIVRTIVKDGNDGTAETYLDSDGKVADSSRGQPMYG